MTRRYARVTLERHDAIGVITINNPADAIASNEDKTTDAVADGEDIEDAAVADSVTEAEPSSASLPAFRLRWLHRPRRKTVAARVTAALVCGSLAASGYLVWHHWTVAHERQRTAEFSTAARNAVVTMLSIDASKARDDVQRFADDTTGQFKAMVLVSAEDFVKAVEQSKVSSSATVQAVAVESMTEDSAVVLVAAKSELTKPDQTKPESRSWRVVVNLQRDGGQLKMSKVEFAS